MTTYTDLVEGGDLRVRVDDNGIAEWRAADGRPFGYGPTNLWLVRVVTVDDLRRPLETIGVRELLVEGDEPDDAAATALALAVEPRRAYPNYATMVAAAAATADVVVGPVELPDIDEAIIAGLTRELGSSHFVQEV